MRLTPMFGFVSKHGIKTEPNLHQSVKHVLIVGQILGQFPVMGITSASSKDLYFSYKSWKIFYCSLGICGTMFIMLMLLFRMATSGANLYVISTFMFHFCKLVITFAFIHMAKCWPKLMREWNGIDQHMRHYGWPDKFEFRIRVILVVFLLLAAIQYIISISSRIATSQACRNDSFATAEYYYKILSYPYIYDIFAYSGWSATLLQITDCFSTFSWCYADIFIMVMSSALAVKFKQVTAKLLVSAETKNVSEQDWKILREDYNKLCRLCKKLDEAISYIVLTSFGTNLYFILILLFNSLRQIKNTLDKVYFFYSFVFLILRTIYVSLYAAWINDESKKPIAILNSVPSSVYNLEIRRFIHQISFDSVALTGRNFFSVTRGLILSVAGAIVTYELVLIQFNENLLKTDITNVTSCTFQLQ